ncbi:hypothetical protein BDF22DRAFT_669173 [Syncephalis plumigaleata]|nr:hypothetical protein BDF22DRAFT_669173 [Syncephalis plumigaleata]
MEFYDLGKRCSLPECQQHDFLPFFCQQCKAWYCLEHRTSEYHRDCTGKLDRVVPTCPACSLPVPISPNEEADNAVNRHLEETCKEMKHRNTSKSKSAKKQRCEAAGCQLVLGTIRPSSTCTRCTRVLCLSHRFPEQHQCREQTRQQRCANAAEQRRTNPTVLMLRVH